MTSPPSRSVSHAAVTGGALRADLADIVPDALVGPCWPAIYAALGTALRDELPVIGGLLNALHLDHTVRLTCPLPHEGERVGCAPVDMTAFAIVSGDHNPIHTSTPAVRLAGLTAPLVHGMWLSATVQHAISAHATAAPDTPAQDGVVRAIGARCVPSSPGSTACSG